MVNGWILSSPSWFFYLELFLHCWRSCPLFFLQISEASPDHPKLYYILSVFLLPPQYSVIAFIGLGSTETCLFIDYLPGGSDGKSLCLQCGRPGFDPWVGKIPLEKEMATHSSTLAWKIPWTEEPGRLQSMGSQRVGRD